MTSARRAASRWACSIASRSGSVPSPARTRPAYARISRIGIPVVWADRPVAAAASAMVSVLLPSVAVPSMPPVVDERDPRPCGPGRVVIASTDHPLFEEDP